MTDDYTFIIDYWKEHLIPHQVPNITLRDVSIPESSRKFLSEVGLPLIRTKSFYIKGFLPFTSILPIEVENERYYVLGDMSWEFKGLSCIAIRENSEEVYKISKSHHAPLIEATFINQNLYTFLYCFTHYNIFQSRYTGQSLSNKEEIQRDYQTLCALCKSEDPGAMSDFKFYWCNMIQYMKVEYGDYLLD